MKASYLLGILLILATAISNMAMAQDPKTVRAMESRTPQSIKDAMAKRAVQTSSRRLAPTSVRPLQMNASRSPKPIDDHVLRMLLERRSKPGVRPSQALASVNRTQGMSQPMMMQGNRNQLRRSAPPTEQMRAAEREEMKTKMLARLKRKP